MDQRTAKEQPALRFGTDGWRGIIAEDFTFANVRRVALAIGAYLCEAGKGLSTVAIGYDTRFHSQAFARTAANELSAQGFRVVLSDRFCSTPCLSSSIIDEEASAGIMVSASHNPPEFNGIKIKTSLGGSAPEALTKGVEALIDQPLDNASAGKVIEKDFFGQYQSRIKKIIDFKAIRERRLRVVADPMFGAGIGYLGSILKDTCCDVVYINAVPDPLFGGLTPEPIDCNLARLKAAVLKSKAAAGLATDGDADRLGVIDENGIYLTPHQVFPLLLHYLCNYKGMKGKVVQSISLGYLSERIANDFGLHWQEVPVGFKYVAEHIITEKILIGGEESGGYGYGNYLPERDGILNSLMVIEMLAVTRKKLSTLLKEIEQKYGSSFYMRTDLRNPGIPKDEFISSFRHSVPEKIAGKKVKTIKDYDGIEFILEDDSWLLLRPSGTEPVIRVYAESPLKRGTEEIIEWGKRQVKLLAQGYPVH